MSKEELKKILKNMSKEDLMDVIVEMQSEDDGQPTHKINKQKKKNRRGKGGRKRKSHSTKIFGNDKGDKARSGKVDTSGGRPNKFLEMMDDISLSSARRSPRNRRPSSKVDVKCRICGIEESVSPALVSDVSRYMCNNCCTRK
jgi:hypothetical protein